MIKNYLPAFLTSLILVLVASAFLLTSQSVSAAATHVVISEVQIADTISTDEFVELYNPTGVEVNLANWKLGRKTASGTDATDLVATISGTIPAHGFFLIASTDYTGSVSADLTYATASGNISTNNTLLLRDGGNTVIDKLGMGTAVDVEGSAAAVPATNDSLERKASSSSTEESMGGVDALLGNGEDTDNNLNDFVHREVPQPQNVESELEPVLASPTATATASPTSSPSATPSESPTVSPSATPSPTASPTERATPTVSPTASPTESATPTATASPTATATPTVTASPSATASPTLEPTVTPSPTPTATATASPTSSPSATPSESPTVSPSATATASPTATAIASPSATPFEFPIAQFNLMCSVRFKTLRFGFTSIQFPIFSCRFVRV